MKKLFPHQFLNVPTLTKFTNMKDYRLLMICFYGIILLQFLSCSPWSECEPVRDIYVNFRDSSSKSLINMYKQGDTLKLKHSNGKIYDFIALKPTKGYQTTEDYLECESLCPCDHHLGENCSVNFVNALNNSDIIKINVYRDPIKTVEEKITIRYKYDYYKSSTSFYNTKSYTINNKTYEKVFKIEIDYYSGSDTSNYVYYNLTHGIIKMELRDNEYFELEP